MWWLLEEAKAADLTEVDLMQNTVFFLIVTFYRQTVVYLYWLNLKEKHFYMSYLQSYSTFEADSIQGCNNTIKNMIDNAQKPQKNQIEKALVTLELITGSWNPQPAIINLSTLNTFFSEDLRLCKQEWDSQV